VSVLSAIAAPVMFRFDGNRTTNMLHRDYIERLRLSEISRSPVATCEPNPPQPLPWCLFFSNA
jgi:hypothetical protein